jgi:hypothetical protein
MSVAVKLATNCVVSYYVYYNCSKIGNEENFFSVNHWFVICEIKMDVLQIIWVLDFHFNLLLF